ncbi:MULTISPECIES: restriction endonuclease subunit S [Flavobacterium]|uniref:Restriction endonuclease subunit S n=1 Tax=Flavobacterium jumunjinense TaxID=998845 RepID=A0ABV5GRV5_9FLAO|nr:MULTISPECIES: restriction endonuclease subunit S [Flavobacterium]
MSDKKLPKGWKIVISSEIMDIRDGTHDTPKYVTENGIPLITSKNLKGNDIDFTKISFISEEDHFEISKRSKVENGDILFAMIGTIGNPAIIKGDANFSIKNVGLFKKNEAKILPEFFVNFLRSSFFGKQLSERKLLKGTTQRFIPLGNLRKIEIPLPPLETQQAIVSKIEELFSELDKGIEDLKTAQQQLKTYRQSVLKWAFEGKLTNENVKDGELPKGWELVKTIDVIKIINNGYTPKSQFLSQDSGEIPFIKVYNLNFNGTLNFKKNPTYIPKANHEKDLKRSICIPGDVLINIVGPPLGKVSIVTDQFPEWNINQAIVMFRPNENVISKYIAYYMQNTFTTNWLEGTSKATAGQWNVKVSTCREIPFPYCSVKEQHQIVQEIESRLSVADKMEESIAQSLLQAESLRQSILKKAFEGKLT